MVWIGIDEAGMGTLAGPMTAAVVCIERHAVPSGVTDSKKMESDMREEVAGEVMDAALYYRTAVRTADAIDLIGMSECWRAMILELCLAARDRYPDAEIILDGNRLVGLPYVRPKVKADARFLSVGAASILAKYVQCCWMDDYHIQYPRYGFDKHRGYGTAQHKRVLEEIGPCPIHRRSFSPIKKILHST